MSGSVQTLSTQCSPRLYVRQRKLLALLATLGGSVGNLDFQKLLFLYCQELASADLAETNTSPYEFVPYRYGPFSFTCYADRRRLIDRGLLMDKENHWMLTKEGRQIARELKDESMRQIVNRYHRLRGDALIAETYRRYPYYAVRSVIAEPILKQDKAALRRITDARPREKPARLSTIGYERRTLENYLNALIRSSVTLLCDVRKNAISRKYGFSKNTLAGTCDGVGIRYQHLPELGIESRQRQRLETQAHYLSLFRTYQKETLPKRQDALEKIRGWLQSGESVALTCYEREANRCHRHCVAAALGNMPDQVGLSNLPGPSRPEDRVTRPHCTGGVYTVRHL